MTSERARKFADGLRNAANIPVDLGDKIEMSLPSYANHDKIRRAQRVFKENFFAIFYSMYLGLLAILAIPSILNVLIHTRRSSSDMTAYKRYMQTIYHTLAWFRNDLKPGTRCWKSLDAVRKMHFHASRSAISASVGMISQKDMTITQYGFMGFTLNNKEQIGLQANRQEMEDYCHFWRVLGSLIGIKDEYNLCCDTLEETLDRIEVVRKEFLLPALSSPPEDFTKMARFVANGMYCFNPRDGYNVMIFTIKRLVGVPNYYYQESEIPDGYERQKLEIYKLGWSDRFFAWFTAFIHEYLLQFYIFRAFFNMQTSFHELLITYFPFLAMYSFGFKNSYVTILSDKDD